LPSGVTRFTAAAIGACVALAALEVARAFGVAMPRASGVAAASIAAVLAATVAVRHAAFVWRGPVVVSFRRREGMLCDAREAGAVRAAAQLRGTLGGAGHLFPRRLLVSALGWGAASVQALALLLPERSTGTFAPLVAVLALGGLAVLFPAVPFYYREAAGGCVVAFPAETCMRLLDASALAPAPVPVELGVGAVTRAGEPDGSSVATDGEAAEPTDRGRRPPA
jgi:hypothetical protein